MNPEDPSPPGPVPPPLSHHLAAARSAIRACQQAAADSSPVLAAVETISFAQQVEEVLRLAEALTITAAAALERAGASAELRLRDTAAVLTATCRVERAEAARRVLIAGATTPHTSISGQLIPAALPALASALNAGEVTCRSAHQIVHAHARISEVLTDPARDALVTTLLDEARAEDDAFVRACAKRILLDATPDAAEPSAATLRMRQGITFGREHGGLVPFTGCMTSLQYEMVITTIGTFTNPRLTQPEGDAVGDADAAVETLVRSADGVPPIRVVLDDRTREQLLLEGLVACCALAARTGALPRNGGALPTVMVTVPYDDLHARVGAAETVFAGTVSASSIRQIACDAKILPVVLGGAGGVTDVGRAKRLFDGDLRTALVARDGGCAFPGCDKPAPWTDGHHIEHWADGGDTSIDNGVLLCRAHHSLVHSTEWEIRMIDRIPHFVAPRQLDPKRSPRRNLRHRRPPATRRPRFS